MPPHTITRPNAAYSSCLVITVKYGGVKATQFFSKYTTESYQQLLSDLTELGFPHPKRANIVFKSYGTLEFFWPIERHENSFFVKNLVKRVNTSEEGLLRDQQRAQREYLSITSMNIREDPDYDPDAELQASASAPLKPSNFVKQLAGQNQSQNQQYSSSKSSVKTPGERFHPYNRLSGWPTASQSDNVSQVPQSKPVKPTSSSQRAAERFLNEMQTSLRGPPRPKEEPIEPTIPPPAPTPLSASAAQKFASWAQRRSSSPDLQVKREQISPSLSFSMLQRDHVGTHIDLTRESVDSSFPSRSSYPSTFNRIPVTNPQTASPEIPGMTYSQRISSNAGRNSLPNLPLFQLQRNNPFSTISGDPHTPVSTSTGSRLPLSVPTPRADDLPSIHILTRELYDLSNNITAALERQNVVVEELRRLNAAYIPPKLSLSSSTEVRAETATKAHLDELEKELEFHKVKQAELAKELQVEKAQRLEMESVLEDIQREQKSPFVVPALLEAFVKISRASTAAMHHKSSLASNQ